ncbi:Uncharacterised protein [Mycobacterium tuberculosis]|nr:Uncharacterised protein [Mycobacterium tuberculosis]
MRWNANHPTARTKLATTPVSQMRGGVNAQRISARNAGHRPWWKSIAAASAAAR